MRQLIVLTAVVLSAAALQEFQKHPCDNKECRAGRECVVAEGEAQCLCVISCPDHFKPVCGTDGVSYDSHCKLHQEACISGTHIGIKHKGYCKKSFSKQWKKDKRKLRISKEELEDELQNDLIKILKKNEHRHIQETKGPAVCFAPQRNALRFLVVDHWQENMKKQPWHVEGMTYRESLWGWFFSCDKDKNNFLTPEELLACIKDVAFFARPGQDTELTKALCIEALVNDGDKSRDWRLDFEEFTLVMDPKYLPKEKKCSLEGKNYLDGEEMTVDCNHCVCAVGNWVCASTDCAAAPAHKSEKEHRPRAPSTGSELDNTIDVTAERPVADPWMENNHKEKQKAKTHKDDFDVQDNMFLDYDLGSTDDTKDEEKQLHLDDYYDDLLEKKVKNPQKVKMQLEKALKEVKMLRKKTSHLQKLFGAKDEDREEIHKPAPSPTNAPKIASSLAHFHPNEKRIHEKFVQKERKSKLNKENKKEIRQQKEKKLTPEMKKHYDEVFKNTKWNDLIDWGDMNKLVKKTTKESRESLNSMTGY